MLLSAVNRALPTSRQPSVIGAFRPVLRHCANIRVPGLVQTAERRHAGRRTVLTKVGETEEVATQPQPQLEVSKIDLRVGRILSVDSHPEADDLYVEQIDLGEAEPRTIVSGLRKYVSVEELRGRLVVVVSNLKPRKLRGVASNGMLLCASNAEHTVVEPVIVPESAAPGERIFFGDDGATQEAAASPNQVQKKKLWEGVQPELKTDSSGIANFKSVPMMTSAGPVQSSLKEAGLS